MTCGWGWCYVVGWLLFLHVQWMSVCVLYKLEPLTTQRMSRWVCEDDNREEYDEINVEWWLFYARDLEPISLAFASHTNEHRYDECGYECSSQGANIIPIQYHRRAFRHVYDFYCGSRLQIMYLVPTDVHVFCACAFMNCTIRFHMSSVEWLSGSAYVHWLYSVFAIRLSCNMLMMKTCFATCWIIKRESELKQCYVTWSVCVCVCASLYFWLSVVTHSQ